MGELSPFNRARRPLNFGTSKASPTFRVVSESNIFTGFGEEASGEQRGEGSLGKNGGAKAYDEGGLAMRRPGGCRYSWPDAPGWLDHASNRTPPPAAPDLQKAIADRRRSWNLGLAVGVPDEAAFLQPLGVERHAKTVMPKDLDRVTSGAQWRQQPSPRLLSQGSIAEPIRRSAHPGRRDSVSAN
jgi:hypothetical protein